MDTQCNLHKEMVENQKVLGTLIQSISDWRQVDEHRQNTSERKLEDMCGEMREIRKWMSKIERSMVETYATRTELGNVYQRIEDTRKEFDAKLAKAGATIIGISGIVMTLIKIIL